MLLGCRAALFVVLCHGVLVLADQNAGFDVSGEPDNAVSSPTYHVGDLIAISWHMNFTNCRLKLVHTPNDHTSTSSYIIFGPTNDTSVEWTVTTLDLSTDNPSFYFSVYQEYAESASFISHNVYILSATKSGTPGSSGAVPNSSSSSSSSSSSVPPSSSAPTSTSATVTSTVKVTPTPDPTPASPAAAGTGSQGGGGGGGTSGGAIAGIAIGSVLATLTVVGFVGWCLWRMRKKAKHQVAQAPRWHEQQQTSANNHEATRGGQQSMYPYPQSLKPELPNNVIMELDGTRTPAELESRGFTK